MKIVAVYLSSRKGSVSGQVMDAMLAGAEEGGAKVCRFDVGKSILGCQGCRSCQGGKVDVCVLKDGLQDYWTEIRDADVLLIGCGNYMGDVQAQAYAFMNRHFAANDSSGGLGNQVSRIPAGKKMIGVFAQGNGNKEFYAETYTKYLRRFERYGMVIQPPVVVTAADSGEEALAGYRAQGKALVE